MQGKDTEQHLYRRVTARLPVKLFIENSIEAKGLIVNMSAGDMTIASRQNVRKGDVIIAYVNGRDRFQGVVSKTSGNGFALKLKLPKARQTRIVDILMQELATKDGIEVAKHNGAEKRGALRRKISGQTSFCERSDGEKIPCSVVDVSLTGLGIKIDAPLKIGEVVTIGKVCARVVREIPDGFGLRLLDVTHSDLELSDEEDALPRRQLRAHKFREQLKKLAA